MTATEIIRKAARGEISYEEANRRLEEIGSDLRLNPNKNTISDAELAETVVDDDPTKVTGWGLLDMGIGKPDKIHIENGKFAYDTGFGESAQCYLLIKGRTYRVMGDHIIAE